MPWLVIQNCRSTRPNGDQQLFASAPIFLEIFILNKAVFFDRDGVLNRSIVRQGKPFAPRTIKNFKLYAGLRSVLRKLLFYDYTLLVVTNQPDIGNGYVDLTTVEAMHSILLERLPIREVFLCPHSQDMGCICRKPNVGLFRLASEKYNIDLTESFMIGDRWSDVEAGNNIGCKSIWIDRGYSEKQPENAFHIVKTTNQAINVIIDLHIEKLKVGRE